MVCHVCTVGALFKFHTHALAELYLLHRHHCLMRRFLYWCLLVVLALRGLLGNAMAIELMPVASPVTMQHHAASSEEMPAARGGHCDTGQLPCHSEPDHAHCASCALCHAASYPAFTQKPTCLSSPWLPPHTAGARFASAWSHPPHKPPIV